MKKDWHGILIVDEFTIKRENEIIYQAFDLHNTLHLGGELQILSALFLGGPLNNNYIPTVYYLGLDNRSGLAVTDTLASLSGEPTVGGYNRQPVSSTSGFTIVTEGNTVKAKSGVIIFSAIGTSWGPVQNMFLTNVSSGSSGVLYSSVPIGSSITVVAGDAVSLRFSMTLKNC
jgi:hypothetical protein